MRRFSSISFAVALAAFVLPFTTVSCDELRVEASGADLILRTNPETEGANPERLELGRLVTSFGGGLATAAFLAFALALFAVVRTWGDGWVLLAGAAGLVALLCLKTRGGGATESTITVDSRMGAWLSAVAAAAGALAVGIPWLRESRPPLRPSAPLVGATLLLVGYLLPSDRSPIASSAYADSLTVREPWRSAFWLLPVAVGIAVLALRLSISHELSTVALGVFVPTGIVVAHEIVMLWRDELRPGAAPFLFLAGMLISAWWVGARRARAGRPAAPAPERAPSPARAPASPSGP